ncbi:MAG: hypothetical protein R2880_18860 [Deinococcales bacterium]
MQGTYETLQPQPKHFNGSLKHTITLTAGLGARGGSLQPLAVTLNGGVVICVEIDEARIKRRIDTAYLDT